jgi:hypothetical protein
MLAFVNVVANPITTGVLMIHAGNDTGAIGAGPSRE